MTTRTMFSSPRPIVLHYHLFKNAGSSLDAILRQAFPNRWVTQEFDGTVPDDGHRRLLAAWMEDHPDAVCFSTHTGRLPPPVADGIRVLPIVLLRHPVDRIASAYAYERTQEAGTFGAVLARNTTLAGYIETRLALLGDPQCRNFHVDFLSRGLPSDAGSPLDRARQMLQQLPFVGIVEDFPGTLDRLGRWLTAEGLGDVHLSSVQVNTSRDHRVSLTARIEQVRETIGHTLFDELIAANEADLAIHREACDRIGVSLA